MLPGDSPFQTQTRQSSQQHAGCYHDRHPGLTVLREQQATEGRGQDKRRRAHRPDPAIVLQCLFVTLEQIGLGQGQHHHPQPAKQNTQAHKYPQVRRHEIKQQRAERRRETEKSRETQLVQAPIGHVRNKNPGKHLRPISRRDQQAYLTGAEAQRIQPGRPERIDDPLCGKEPEKDQIHSLTIRSTLQSRAPSGALNTSIHYSKRCWVKLFLPLRQTISDSLITTRSTMPSFSASSASREEHTIGSSCRLN